MSESGPEGQGNDLQREPIPNRDFVVLQSELTSPEERMKWLAARNMAKRMFSAEVLDNADFQRQVNATIDIMAIALVSTGRNYGEGDYPAHTLGKFFKANPEDPDSIPQIYHNEMGTWDAVRGAKYVREWQLARRKNFSIPEQLMLGLISAGDDLVFTNKRGEDERQSAETIVALMHMMRDEQGREVFSPDMIESVRACITSSVFVDRQGYNGKVQEEFHPQTTDTDVKSTLDSLEKVHNAGVDGDLIVLATRQGPQRGMLHEMEALWRLAKTAGGRADVVRRFGQYFNALGADREEVEINDIIEFIDSEENSDLRIAFGNALIKNSEFVRGHRYTDNSLNEELQPRKEVNADFQKALGEALIKPRDENGRGMTVKQAYLSTIDFANYQEHESLDLVFTPRDSRPVLEDDGEEKYPSWMASIEKNYPEWLQT